MFFFHKSEENFIKSRQSDIEKTNLAFSRGYYLIQIDHTQIDKIDYHLDIALNNNYDLYVSSQSIYEWINIPTNKRTNYIKLPKPPKLILKIINK